MGYSTDFTGELLFTKELTQEEMETLEQFFGEDCRSHKHEWKSGELTWMNIELNEDATGIQWDGSEKSYDMVEKINLIIDRMHDWGYTDFGLTGELVAQGERLEDRWVLVMEDGRACEKRILNMYEGEKVVCPHCGEAFYLK